MKKFLIIILLFSGYLVKAQNNPPTSDHEELPKIESTRMFRADDGILKCYGTVSLESERLAITGADSILINRRDQIYFIYGAKDCVFKGNLIVTTENKDPKLLTYRVGDDFIKLE